MGFLARLFNKSPKRNKDEGTTIEKYYKSFNHALDGLIYCLKYEHNMIIILSATIVVFIAGLYFNITIYEWLFILFICGAIAACEMINSAIEAAVDLTTTKMHPLARIAKDCASAATLILCITAFFGGMIIFIPRIASLMG